jgi:serine/tyrosine/threonine adenylyltransferase
MYALSAIRSIHFKLRVGIYLPIVSTTNRFPYQRSMTTTSFDNRSLRSLPIDRTFDSDSRQVSGVIFSLVDPTPVINPKLVAVSAQLLSELQLPVLLENKFDLAEVLSGNRLLPGSQCSAHCYAGHQFGVFSGQLGDGAAISLGELLIRKEAESRRLELQLKGSGKTPFSRGSDGRKVLRSSIREFLCSEAMFHLGIPTTRALACVTSDSTVARDPHYDGHVVQEKCTIVSRVAENFFRFGSFEIFKVRMGEDDRAGPSAGDDALKQSLLDHIISGYFPSIDGRNRYVAFFTEIVRRTACLVAQWQAVGFVHGVLNTDNMSVMGITLDYGPFGFMELFDEDFVPNGSDKGGRYSFKQQPEICRWNLKVFAVSLQPLLSAQDADAVLGEFDAVFRDAYLTRLRCKLGLVVNDDTDEELIDELQHTMGLTFVDFTDTFVAISDCLAALSQSSSDVDRDHIFAVLINNLVSRSASPTSVVAFFRRKFRIHKLGMHPDQIEQLSAMLLTDSDQLKNVFEGANIDDIKQEVSREKRTLTLLAAAAKIVKFYEGDPQALPNKLDRDRELWSLWVSKYRTRLQRETDLPRSMLVASEANPRIVLRNWMAQEAIEYAQNDDFSRIQTLLAMLEQPFRSDFSSFEADRRNSACQTSSIGCALSEEEKHFLQLSPDWSNSLLCTCSS